MSELSTLRRKLLTLSAYQSSVRLAAALTGLGIAVSWTLLAIFGADFWLQLTAPRRLVVMALGAAAVAAAYRWRCRPLLRPAEDRETLALQVERRHQLRNDLIAALQFDRASAGGSEQLRRAVILRGAEMGRTLKLFAGSSAAPLPRRAALLCLTLAATAALVIAFPDHASVFARRLMLGADHYPSRTRIERIWINDRVVLAAEDSLRPADARCAQGEPLEMLLVAVGRPAPSGDLRLRHAGRKVTIPLAPLPPEARLERLRQAAQLLGQAAGEPLAGSPAGSQVATEELAQSAAWARADGGAAAELLRRAADGEFTDAQELGRQIRRAAALLDDLLRHGATALPGHQVFAVELPSAEEFEYQLSVGDAWTEPARVSLNELPVIELLLADTPPDYARRRSESTGSPRQMRVLEGSRIDLTVVSTNGKALQEAWVSLTPEDGPPQRHPLIADNPERTRWTLAGADTLLHAVFQPLQYEVHVVDDDQLRPDRPLQGRIFVRPDQLPRGAAQLVHRVVLASAAPAVEVQATDDFAIEQLQLHLRVERAAPDPSSPDPTSPDPTSPDPTSPDPTSPNPSEKDALENASPDASDAGAPAQPATPPATGPAETPEAVENAALVIPLLPVGQHLASDQLPYRGRHVVRLAPLRLVKGDRLKITLEIRDYRGAREGRAVYAEPLVLEVSDELGVMAAIGEADELTEKQLNELIQQQIDLGESP